jgi:lipoprotein-releasing system permease protein
MAWEKSVAQLSYIDHVQSHIQKPGILVGKTGLAGIVIKGIGQDMPQAQIKKNLIQGLPYLKNSQDVIISQILAKQLKTSMNQSLILYFLSQPERPRKVKVTGIYETGLDELDKIFILADRDWVGKMNGWSSDSLGSYEIILKKGVDLNQSAYYLEKELPTEWKLETIEELYTSLFDWMNMLDRNIVIFISLLLVVACFNLIATLWVLIMERIPMVGLLKALGSSQKQIRTIFWWNGFFILLRGLLIGNIIAILFCYVQFTYKLIPLDPENYYMNSVPILWDTPTWLYVNVGTCLLVALTITIPTLFIKKIEPKDAINYKS